VRKTKVKGCALLLITGVNLVFLSGLESLGLPNINSPQLCASVWSTAVGVEAGAFGPGGSRGFSSGFLQPESLKTGVSNRLLYLRSRQFIEILFVVLVSPAALLVTATAAAAVAILMGRPVFIRQERVGLHGRVFKLLKLRTMKPGAARRGTATLKQDPRVTSFGRFLRRTHIDEIPQLWNVLIGEMSLIGPRPEQVHLVAKYRVNIPNYDLRHLIRPGLSGYAQVYYGYAANLVETRRKLAYDLFYIQHFGAILDLQIALMTIRVCLRSTNAR
jgi:lipopolysaccharide/colanic/teichoic acid biosynthesis glycosyltransferase